MNYRIFLIVALGLLASCLKEKKSKAIKTEAPARVINIPKFNGDSAYYFVKRQVDFGPRIPNTKSHRAAGDYLVKRLKGYGADINIQEFESANYQGGQLALKNIIASFNPSEAKRILLAAHWDTRPFSDKDKQKPNATFDGANDGASGVAVLLEVARVLSAQTPEVGVDIILFDGEDWGEKEGSQGSHPLPENLKEWWCLGSQYWAKHKHKQNYSAYYGVLLDMVGAKNAQFHREGYSLEYAPSIVEKVWNTASRLGYSHVFVKRNQGGVTDDHVFVNEIAKIPMVDIIHYDPAIGFFGDFHHSQKDNMDIISKETLQIVGETILNVVYYEEN
jgi:glutaminyl-peptide cyclotransferase